MWESSVGASPAALPWEGEGRLLGGQEQQRCCSPRSLETAETEGPFACLCPDPTLAALASAGSSVPLSRAGERLSAGVPSRLSSPWAHPGHISRASESQPLFLERAGGRSAAQAIHTFMLYLFSFCFTWFTRQERGTAGDSWKRCEVRAGHSRMQTPSRNFRYESP